MDRVIEAGLFVIIGFFFIPFLTGILYKMFPSLDVVEAGAISIFIFGGGYFTLAYLLTKGKFED